MSKEKVIIKTENEIHQLSLDQKLTYQIGNQVAFDVYVKDEGDEKLSLSFNAEKNSWELVNTQTNICLEIGKNKKQSVSLNNKSITVDWIADSTIIPYQLTKKSNWHISNDKTALVQLAMDQHEKILVTKGPYGWEVNSLNGEVYVNNKKELKPAVLENGDFIYVADAFLYFYDEELHIANGDKFTIHLPQLVQSSYDFYDEYPDYHRSPRIIYRDPEEKVTIGTPDAAPSKPSEQLLKTILPPLVMLSMTILMAIIQPRGLYVLVSAGTTVMTVIFSISSYIKSRKKYKVDMKDRVRIYEEYLTSKSKELHQVNQEQRTGKLYHYPDVETLSKMITQYNHRIYEKTPLHFDFLNYRLGLGKVKSSMEVSYSGSDGQKKLDDLEKEGFNLYQDHQRVDGVPITTELTLGPIGYIGPRPLVIEQLQLLVNQLAFAHSYHDLQFITIFPEEELAQWSWMRWLPHATLQDMNVRGFVYHQRSRDQVLNSLTQILKSRQNAKDEGGRDAESTIFTPHYVVLITDVKLILDHTIMEFFNEDPTALGCSIIFVQDVLSSLSENVKTVIDIRDRNTGVMVLENGDLKNTEFKLDHFPEGFDKEQIPRTLAPLNHLQNLKNSIPEAVTFLEMYEVDRFEELNVLSRWASHSPHKSLAVPLGLRGKEDLVNLNLHEKAHGPHGLVAGTTGSGKSEIIQSYILSLAVNFHPYDVAFLLIDYKGGGMANLFRNLPHLLGSITNLDGAQSMRALISINAELKRRQRLFSENNVNHINQYQKLYKEGEVSDPMPHLFLISDEFAELKSEQPEFMKELVSTARIGRSLGIHLILATQKPSGVVNEQIWSNSKFKLALKVADKSDSMEMLKTPDAAEITLPGRAYLQVGNNEIYELFQSAWSGADYNPDKEDSQAEDLTIYAINDLGQYEILSEDLSGLENSDEMKTVPTELDAVIDGIHDLTVEEGIESLPRPWLPPLEERLYLPNLDAVDYKEFWAGEKGTLEPVVGIADIPSMQAQETFSLNLSKEGHLAAFSSPGYGKSTFLQMILMGLARKHNPARLHAYLMDFGTNGLLPLRGLPHIADTMNSDEDEKIGKFIRRMEAEIKLRKKMLSQYAVANMEMYEKASGNEEPSIVILVDGFEGFKGMKYEDVLEKIFTQIAREGAGIGIHLLITAGRQSSMRLNLQSNIKLQLAMKLIDDNEAKNIVGRTQLAIDDLPGRGLVKFDEPALFQAALPTLGEDTLDIIEAIREEAKEMDAYWTGERPEEIPMMPDDLNYEQFKQNNKIKLSNKAKNIIPIGLDFENVEPFYWNLDRTEHLLIVGGSSSGKTNALKVILESTVKKQENGVEIFTHILDNTRGKLSMYKENESTLNYITDKENYEQFFIDLKNELDDRVADRKNDEEEFSQHLILIQDIDTLFSTVDTELVKLIIYIFDHAPRVNIQFIIVGKENQLSGYSDLVKRVKQIPTGLIFANYGEQNVIKIENINMRTPKLPKGAGYFVTDSIGQSVKIPLLK
ncbi:type VII secretion protein EssC [Carnobacterium divergens]|uniref:type VII secretion protein EssC n=1 Tax=Carnobacterium divergens TaxID=2748 RepID=UPI00193110D8|nr:type VII secretion protein EssC [Carnobacterium divergens]